VSILLKAIFSVQVSVKVTGISLVIAALMDAPLVHMLRHSIPTSLVCYISSFSAFFILPRIVG